ncbi:MAG: protein BatD [Candidatus Kuenenia sp.]|nr:protein BatD [Candidatus Kuenenia hertensis]
MKKHIGIFGFLALLIIILGSREKAYSQEISLISTVDKKIVTLDDKLTLTLTVHGTQDVSQPTFPEIEGFNVLYGPQISAQTRIINGQVSVSKGYIYVLRPVTKGKHTIGPSTMEYKGKRYTSSPIIVEVVESTPSSGTKSFDLDKLVFVELKTDNEEPYLYEQVILYFKLYFQKGLPIADIDYTAPATKNFMEEKLGDQIQYEEVRDGIIYNVLELRTAVFPIVSGELTISPAKLKCNLIVQEERNRRVSPRDDFFGDSFFDDFFGRGQRKYPVERITNPVLLKIKPLPEYGRPEEFKGAVGNFNMEASIKTSRVKVGDPITLSVSVYGEGNIQTINEPELVFNNKDDFKVYPAESTTQITNREEVIRGRKVFSKVIEPQKTELKSIPAIVFSYFDPRENRYKTITKDPIPITVESWEQEIPIQLTLSQEKLPASQQQVRLLTQDILPIMTGISSLKNHGYPVYKNPFLIGGLFLPAIILITSFFVVRHKDRLQTDIGYARNRRAHSVANRRLGMAQSALSGDSSSEFYACLSRGITEYLADKFNIPAASASGDRVSVLLRNKGVPVDVIEDVTRCLSDFDYRRFSSDTGTKDEMEHSLNIAEQLITKLEKQL